MKKLRMSILLLLLTVFFANARESASFDMGMDLMNRYVWRGLNLSSSPVIQPYLEYNKGNFTLGTWGSYALSQEPYQEVDVYASYSINNLTITINDYFNPLDSMLVTHNYFDWNSNTTSHAIEAIFELSDLPGIPLSLTAGVFIFGNDKNESGSNYYSTYLEAGYDFNIGEQAVHSFVGITPSEGLYNDEFGVVNMGLSLTKEIALTDRFNLPLNASFSLNPSQKIVFFVAGVSF